MKLFFKNNCHDSLNFLISLIDALNYHSISLQQDEFISRTETK